jgi:hypothetical protein
MQRRRFDPLLAVFLSRQLPFRQQLTYQTHRLLLAIFATVDAADTGSSVASALLSSTIYSHTSLGAYYDLGTGNGRLVAALGAFACSACYSIATRCSRKHPSQSSDADVGLYRQRVSDARLQRDDLVGRMQCLDDFLHIALTVDKQIIRNVVEIYASSADE